jgi:hypothetical protein
VAVLAPAQLEIVDLADQYAVTVDQLVIQQLQSGVQTASASGVLGHCPALVISINGKAAAAATVTSTR